MPPSTPSTPSLPGAVSIAGGQIQFNPGTLFDPLNAGEIATVEVNYTMRDDADLVVGADADRQRRGGGAGVQRRQRHAGQRSQFDRHCGGRLIDGLAGNDGSTPRAAPTGSSPAPETTRSRPVRATILWSRRWATATIPTMAGRVRTLSIARRPALRPMSVSAQTSRALARTRRARERRGDRQRSIVIVRKCRRWRGRRYHHR